MNASEMLRLAFRVVADWRVIITALITIFVISLANYVIRYRKRPISLKKLKKLSEHNKAAKPEKKEEGQGEASEAGEGEADSASAAKKK